MGIPTVCEECNRQVSGQVATLRKVQKRYVCALCERKLLEAPTPSTRREVTYRYYCSACSSYFNKPSSKGNGLVELLLYLLAIVPGLLYSVWRRSGSTAQCPKCASSALIDAAAGTHVRCPDCKELVLAGAARCKHCGCSLVPQGTRAH
jgi:hypothetical protein